MPEVTVLNQNGGEVGKLDLSESVFDVEANLHCVRAAVQRQLARARQGTAKTKERDEVRGGGAKPWRQKGTGRARAGSNRSPIWRGGGTIFGPRPRKYGGGINRKVTRRAILSCLSAFQRDGELRVVESLELPEVKTKQVNKLLSDLKLEDGRVLLVTATTNVNLALSARNLPHVDVINSDNLNAYDLTTHRYLVADKAAIERIQEVYA